MEENRPQIHTTFLLAVPSETSRPTGRPKTSTAGALVQSLCPAKNYLLQQVLEKSEEIKKAADSGPGGDVVNLLSGDISRGPRP
jgi:hypothetical protein